MNKDKQKKILIEIMDFDSKLGLYDEPLMSADAFFRNNYSSTYIERERVAYLEDVFDAIKQYAKYHTEWHQQKYDKVEEEINRLQEKYDENGYDCSLSVKLQRIEQHFEMALNIYKSTNNQ